MSGVPSAAGLVDKGKLRSTRFCHENGRVMNIVNWFLGVLFIGIALVAGVVAGAIGYGIVVGITRNSRTGWGTGIAILVSAVVGQVVFWGLCAWTLRGYPAPIAEPTAGEVVGVWQMSQQSIQDLHLVDDDRGSPHTLTISDDGTVKVENIPTWWLYYKGASRVIVSGEGTWSITKRQDKWGLLVNLSELSLEWSEAVLFLAFEGETPPYLLYDHVGDADEGRRVVFLRQPVVTVEIESDEAQ